MNAKLNRIDKLAQERTILANERTMLAHIRTAFACFLFGFALLRFTIGWAYNIGMLSMAFGFIFLFSGIIYYPIRNKRIKSY